MLCQPWLDIIREEFGYPAERVYPQKGGGSKGIVALSWSKMKPLKGDSFDQFWVPQAFPKSRHSRALTEFG